MESDPMNIFRRLRWQLTLSYTLVTVSALMVITLLVGAIFLTNLFLPENSLDPESLVKGFLDSDLYDLWSHQLSEQQADSTMINQELTTLGDSALITYSNLFRIGSLQISASTNAVLNLAVIDRDGRLVGTTQSGSIEYNATIGSEFDPGRIPGLETPYQAAFAGTTDPARLYTTVEPNRRTVAAVPLIYTESGGQDRFVGVVVIILDTVPTRQDIPAYIKQLAGGSLIFIFVGVAVMGSLFGAFFAHALASRFRKISTTIDEWSAGDFSNTIRDATGDEISRLSQRLNVMAGQLQDLLHRRQDMAVSEERNRLARDLHDSAKQQALAASLELSTAMTLFDRDPGSARAHLTQAEGLVDRVRVELTNLVHELRPLESDSRDFSGTLRDYVFEWSQRSEISLNADVQDVESLPLRTREALYRITQEALSNVARHSAARNVSISLTQEADSVFLLVQDDGRGFDPATQTAGMGLRSMRERASGAGGSLTLESTPGQGTRITVRLPIKD
jgi:signal transduction histidine kinase